jgi:5-methylcytosine-specific restriction endonuclease McrA
MSTVVEVKVSGKALPIDKENYLDMTAQILHTVHMYSITDIDESLVNKLSLLALDIKSKIKSKVWPKENELLKGFYDNIVRFISKAVKQSCKNSTSNKLPVKTTPKKIKNTKLANVVSKDNSVKYVKTKINASLKQSVWLKYIGDLQAGKCMCCSLAVITKQGFDAGHVVAESKGGATKLQNLRPVCKTCNTSMGTKNMEEFMRECGYDKPKTWNGV